MAATDRDALVALFHSTDGNSWKISDNWNTTAELSTWYGVKVDGQGRVVALSLAGNHLRGSIPKELGALTNLESFDLHKNELIGSIPKELGALTNLTILDLDKNQLTGSIPKELGALTKLTELSLGKNQLTGSIPKELGAPTKLWSLILDGNYLTGSIPTELGALTELEILKLGNNKLMGSIPQELRTLTKMVVLRLHGNFLTGSIPKELGALTNLESLKLDNNELMGSIPKELETLTKIVVVHLDGNNLTGSIPKELGALTSLERLDLHKNQLMGRIPKELGTLTKIRHLNLGRNNLTGSIPKELGALTNLENLKLHKNQLMGSIPKELGTLAKIVVVHLDGNNLTGSIPKALGALTELEILHLGNNKLMGSIPKELGTLAKIFRVKLEGNNLTGSIPRELGFLTDLVSLDLGGNQLTGSIPKDLGALTKLQDVRLGKNQLSDSIPKELGALTKIIHLDLGWNNLTGSFPKELGALTNLTRLRLENNQLTGSIPMKLGALTKLKYIDLGTNQLTAFWDLGTEVFPDEELLQGNSAGNSLPKQLEELLATLAKLGPSLGVKTNPWQEPPEAVVSKGMSAVREYFTDLFAEGTAPVGRKMVKVVLVGQEGAGKTSLRQSLRTGRPTPTSGPEESTVQIDVEQMDVNGVTLRVYDCAGQVAYTGLLQMFLSPRAVSLLVCDTGAFGQRDGSLTDSDQLKKDGTKLQELRVCDWLRSLSFRIPDSDVVMVATKCDLAAGMATDAAGRIEGAIGKWLESWSGAGMTAVHVEDGVSLTSCFAPTPDEDGGAALGTRKSLEEQSTWACDWNEGMSVESQPSLLHRVWCNSKGEPRGAYLVLPRSWNIALEVLDALGSGRDPVEWAHQTVLASGGPKSTAEVVPAGDQRNQGVGGLTWADLSTKWNEVVAALQGERVSIVNPDHALEGALLIREHEGSLVRHETYVFLDVTWLAQILKPLLNHRDDEDPFCGDVSLGDTGITLKEDKHITSWNRLKGNGVLEPSLARVLWPDGLSEYVLPALDSLGLTYPLDDDSAEGLVVLLRLDEKRPEDVGKELDDFRRHHTAVLSVKWKIFLGVPPGAIEKMLTRCCRLGALRTFWRFGVLVQGSLGGGMAAKTFALLIEYSHDTCEVDMKVYGSISTAAPWAALSFGISVFQAMCSEFPGLRWRASIKCPQHEQEMQISKAAIRPGDNILLGATCSLCNSRTGGLGAAAMYLLEIVDVHECVDKLFQEMAGRLVEAQDLYPVLHPEAARGLHPEQVQQRFDAWWDGVKEEMDDMLRGARGSIGGEDVESTASVASPEVARLERLVTDLQRQVGQQHQDVRERIGAVDTRLVDMIDADDGVMGRLDFLVVMMMAMRRDGFDTPRRACVLPPWDFAQGHGLSDEEQAPECWVKRLGQWREDDFKQGKGVFKKKMRLFLVCAVTHRLVPCGPNGQGYDIQRPRSWFRMSVSVATFVLQVVCATLAAIAAAPVSGADCLADETFSSALGSMESMLEAQLAGLTLDDGGVDVAAGPQTAQLEGGAYTSLREFIHGVEDTARLEIAKATKKAQRERRAPPTSSEFVFFEQKMVQVQRRDGDAAVQWVLKEHESAWYDQTRSAPVS